jgi:hypothetical protein
MNLKNELNENEINLLKSINVAVENKEYTIEDTGNIIDALDDAIHNHLNKELNFTEKAIEFENLQNKIIELEDNI